MQHHALLAALRIIVIIDAVASKPLELPIAAIFEAGSVGESAFSFAVYSYNKNAGHSFHLLPKLTVLTPPYDGASVLVRFCELMRHNVLAVFVGELASDASVGPLLSDAASALKVPLLTTSGHWPGDFTQNLMPVATEALVDILVHENWTSFTYLTTGVAALDRLHDLVLELHSRGRNLSLDEVSVHVISDLGDSEHALNSLISLESALKRRPWKRVVVDARVGETKHLMRMISQLGMNRGEYEFLFAGLNVADTEMGDYIFSGVKLAGFRLMDPERADAKQFQADWDSWNGNSGHRHSQAPPPFYHAALMSDSLALFTSTLQCHLQHQLLDAHELNRTVADIAEAAEQLRASFDGAPSGQSSCYVGGGGRLMYQHSAYQVRRDGAIPAIRAQFASASGEGCGGAMGLAGLTGDLQAAGSVEPWRRPSELTLWATSSSVGLRPIARWASSNGLDFAVFKPSPNPEDLTLSEDTKKPPTGLPQVWESDFDPNVIIDRSRLADYRNHTVRVVTIWSNPFVQAKQRKLGAPAPIGIDRFEGFCVDLLEEISKIVGFKYELHIVYDGIFGTKVGEHPPEQVEVLSRRPLSNKIDRRVETRRLQIWDGLIGEILNNTADLVVAPLTVNFLRAQVVEFSEPFLAFGLSLIIKKPGKQKPGSFSFLHPLSDGVWLAIFGAWVAVSLGLFSIAKLSPTEWKANIDPQTRKRKFSRQFNLGNSVWISFAAFAQQGVDFAPRAPGTRVVAAVWWFVTLILIAFYTANLAAFLTISLRVSPINSWIDLLNSDLEYGSLRSGSTRDFFFNTKLEPFAQLGAWMKKNQHALSKSVDDGVRRVRSSKGKYAFVLESVMNEYFNNREPCDTMMAGSPFGNYGYGIALPRKSPMKEALSDAVLQLRERQVLATLRKKWWIERGQCNAEGGGDDERPPSNALSLINVAGVFYILVGGLLLALLVASLELALFLLRGRQRTRRQRGHTPRNFGGVSSTLTAATTCEEDNPWTLKP